MDPNQPFVFGPGGQGIRSTSHESVMQEFARQAAAFDGNQYYRHAAQTTPQSGSDGGGYQMQSSHTSPTAFARPGFNPGQTTGTSTLTSGSQELLESLMLMDTLLGGHTSTHGSVTNSASGTSRSSGSGGSEGIFATPKAHTFSKPVQQQPPTKVKLESISSRGSPTPFSSADDRSVDGKRKRGDSVKVYDYLQRLQALRQYVKSRLTPQEYEIYNQTVDTWMQQNLELLLPLDYKDLCFAEETVDRKVKQLEEFFALINLPALCWRRVGDILSVSDAMCRLFNMTKDEFKQCNVVEMLHRDDMLDCIRNLFIRLHLFFQPTQVVRDMRLVNPKTGVYTRFRGTFVVLRDTFHLSSMTVAILIPYDMTPFHSE